jgi:RNA polymerase sigma-70 factor (ECF subfamily)
MLIAFDDPVLSQDTLVAAARRGDEAAFARLTSAELAGLYRIAWLILRDESAAEDALQEAMFRAWRDIRSLRSTPSLRPWLRRLTVHAAYDAARRRSRQRVRELPITASSRTFPAPEQTIAERESLRQAFMVLSPEHRAVVVLRYYLDLPTAEVAQSLGIPEGTVKSRLHHAMSAMRAGIEAADRMPESIPPWSGEHEHD